MICKADSWNCPVPFRVAVLVDGPEYPFAAWKSLGLKPPPSKRRAKISDLAEAHRALRSLTPFTTNRPPNRDQLQAIVGNPPRREEGHWREGYIVLPVPPRSSPGLRWLH
jgi:hypothetical protein